MTVTITAVGCCEPIRYSGRGVGVGSFVEFNLDVGNVAGSVQIDISNLNVADQAFIYDANDVLIGSTPKVGDIDEDVTGFWQGTGVYDAVTNPGTSNGTTGDRDTLNPIWSLSTSQNIGGQGRLNINYDPSGTRQFVKSAYARQ